MATATYTQGTNFYNPKTGIAEGTVQYDPNTGAKLGTGQSVNYNLTPVAPTNAGAIVQNSPVKLTTSEPAIGNIAGATAANAASTSNIDTQTQIQKDTQDRADQIAKEQTALSASTKPFLDKILGAQSPSEVRTATEKSAGINPAAYFADQKAKIAEIDSLTQDYNKAVANRDKLLSEVQDNPTGLLSNALDSRIIKIKNNAAIELNQMSSNINSRSATLQALQGNFNAAEDFVKQAVSDATATQKYNYDMYTTLYQTNKDIIDNLDKPYAEAFQAKLQADKNALDQAIQDKNAVGQLMINPAYANAGIHIGDTLAEAYTKASRVAAQTPAPGNGTETINGKPLTDAQTTSLGYAQRLNDSDSTISSLGSKFTGLNSYISGSSFFPNFLKSDERQQYEQAQRNFVNAILRKESGAAISPSEFDSASQQYFPQPGDSQAVIDQKTTNRQRAISNLFQASNTTAPAPTPVGGDYNAYLKAIE